MLAFVGNTILLSLTLRAGSQGMIIGETPTVSFRRLSDSQYLDWNDTTFKASGWTTKAGSLTEIDSTNLPGVYQRTLNTAAIITSPGWYVAEYYVNGDVAGADAEEIYFTVDTTTLASQSSLNAASAVVSDIHDTDLVDLHIDVVDLHSDVVNVHDDLVLVAATVSDIHNVDLVDLHTDVVDVHGDLILVAATVSDIHDTDLPAVKNIIDDLHNTDIPDLHIDIGLVAATVSDIHDTDLPDLHSDVLTIDGVVDTIQGRTDNLPASPAQDGHVTILPTLADMEASTVLAMQSTLLRVIGLTHENYRVLSPVYTAGKLTSATLKIYPTAADVDTDTNAIAEYAMTATFVGDEMTSYRVKKV